MGIFKHDKLPKSDDQNNHKGKPTILLVDDEQDNLIVLKSMLEDDWHVLTASSGQQALQLIDELCNEPELGSTPIPLIISDQRMPGMTGTQFLKQSMQRLPDAIRILLTGYSDMDAIIEAVNEAEIYRYLNKPISGDELKRSVDSGWELFRLRMENRSLLEELRISYERIKQLDQDKLAFLRFLAHEMNTPLNWIGATQVVDRDSVNEDVNKVLDIIDQGRDRLRNLIFSVLRYFERAGDDIKVAGKPCELKPLLEQSFKMAQIQLRKNQLAIPDAISLDVSDDLKEFLDEKLIIECFHYLFLDCLAHARGELKLSAKQDGEGLFMTLSDSKRTVDLEQQRMIFKPFTREVRVDESNGFGLNLPMCHYLIRAMGGEIWLEDQVNPATGEAQGVAFQIRLPQ